MPLVKDAPEKGSWQELYDRDLTQVASHAFAADGESIVDEGVAITALNVGALGSVAFVNGTGLVVSPETPANVVYAANGALTVPGVAIRFADLYEDFQPDTPVRVWLRTGAFTPAANVDGFDLFIFDITAPRGVGNPYESVASFGQVTFYDVALVQGAAAVGAQAQFWSVNGAPPGDVIVLELPKGLAGGVAALYGGAFGADWPDPSDLVLLGTFGIPGMTLSPDASAWAFAIGAQGGAAAPPPPPPP